MGYTQVGLEQKILEMYPEISQHGISTGISFHEGKNAWIIKFRKDGKELTTHLEKKDADDCMNNVKCVYLGIQVEQFIKNFEMRK
jgi:dolichyl-phosphate-mannose--protein O-mannosyl transferase